MELSTVRIPGLFVSDEESSQHLTSLWLNPQLNEVVVIEEVLLFDFAAIVAAVGGSLGLFIGFSFLDVAKLFVQKLGS